MYPSISHIARGLLCIDQERPRESIFCPASTSPLQDDCALYRIVILDVHICKEATTYFVQVYHPEFRISKVYRYQL